MKNAVTFDGDGRRMRVVVSGLLALAAATAIIAAVPVAPTPTAARAADITLIYVGADDCAPCRVWQSGDGVTFRQSSEFTRIAYVEIKSPRLHDLLKDEHWPEKVRAYRDSLKRSDGVPLWLLVSNGKVIAQRFGPAAWRASMLPSIKSALR
ncbi:MAG: hypothetical protein R3D82_16975 [Xanthobacteraceae bacterium]